ncbi:MAG: bifunctional diaminohydroxyphosphoribosylaminopyrimidine deaminase/5-amino-6-(5-phosphoribosylamino)uracil reductase RibD [Lentisphaeria bacterium]|nr:bifunctional diaminohydroxyphosphoribosylaminopyrimidine deaminase/5-amino-6-(5-phosphoribosylamino)uracil reductase RibD [Lentisphaeria bacterium]
MQQALELAKRAWGQTSPNPMVGAVIVKDQQVLGEGWHHKAGEAHAEVNAIADAGMACLGADIYVTLEPCSTHGRTPPCTQAIINAGIKRVFIGCLDPNPNHAGKAIDKLESAGIEVCHSILEKECRELNEHFFHWITTGQPFVMLKMAMTLDGKIATKSGQSQWITGPESREYVQTLRKLCDAIMVGGETVRADNPSLTVREEGWSQPQRVIASRQNDFDSSLKIFNDQTPIFFNDSPETSWDDLLCDLGQKGVTSLLIEGGGELASRALRARVINKAFFMIAPKILGGKESRPVVGGQNPVQLSEALELIDRKVEIFGQDIMISGYL